MTETNSSPYLTADMTEAEKYRYAHQPSKAVLNIKKIKPCSGFFVSDVEEEIVHLTQRNFSADPKKITAEAIRRHTKPIDFLLKGKK